MADWRSACTWPSARGTWTNASQPKPAAMIDGEAKQGRQQAGRAEAARLQRRHFAVVVHAAQGQNHGQQQSDRHDDR